jgi:hypothetical protein
MTSTQRRSHEVRERCRRHGLVVVRDGACLLCLKDRRGLKRPGVFWALTGLAALGMFLIPKWFAYGRQATFADENAISRTREKVARTPSVNFDVDAARNRRGAPLANSGAESPVSNSESEPHNAEDHYLGAPPVRLPLSAAAPPTPPRAPVEDAPPTHDDPADFEVPPAGQ